MTRTTVQNTALRAEAIASAQALLRAENTAGVWINLPGTPPQVLMAGDTTAMAGLLMRNDPKAADHLAREAGFYIGLRDLDRAWIGVNASGLVSMFFKEAPRAEDYPELLILDFVRSAAAQAAPVVAASELTDEQINAALDSINANWWDVPHGATLAFARAIEVRVRQLLAAVPDTPAAQAQQPAGDGWIACADRLPEVSEDDGEEFNITCRRANGKSYVFSAYYLNSKGVVSDDDPETIFSGWYLRTEHPDYDGWYTPVCDAGDVVTHWQALPPAPGLMEAE